MTAGGATLRSELIGLGGIVERNVYLTKRYFLWDVAFMVWTIANTLTIVFIARAVHVSPAAETVSVCVPTGAFFGTSSRNESETLEFVAGIELPGVAVLKDK